MKSLFLTFILFTTICVAKATSWSAALPYTKTDTQHHITIKAKAYQPYDYQPYGAIEVYHKNNLLYTIDKYFREPVFTSNDGRYLAVINTIDFTNTDFIYVGNGLSMAQNWIDFDDPAILIYKDGLLHKKYSLRDVIDTSKLASDDVYYNWGYSTNCTREHLQNISYDCESCIEIYGKEILNTCDTNEIDSLECLECNNHCDSVELYREDLDFLQKTIFIKNNILHIVTNQDKVILLDFRNLTLHSIPLNDVISNKQNFNPYIPLEVYDTSIAMPDRSASPLLASGEELQSAINKFLLGKACTPLTKQSFFIRIHKFVINNRGYCEELEMHINKTKTLKSSKCNQANFDDFSNQIREWLMLQRYDTSDIPKGFKKYCFYVLLDYDLK